MKKIIRQLMKMTFIALTAFIMMLAVPTKIQAENTSSFDPVTGTLTVKGKGILYRGRYLGNYRNETKHLVISEGFTSIEEECFRGWRETETVDLPYSLHEIEPYAFQSTLFLEVNYHGTGYKWEGIEIGEGNESLFPRVKFLQGYSLNSIQVTKPPLKTEYRAGETFDPEGMIVMADFDNFGTLKTTRKLYADQYVIEDMEPLTVDQNYVVIRYQYGCQKRWTYVTINVTE